MTRAPAPILLAASSSSTSTACPSTFAAKLRVTPASVSASPSRPPALSTTASSRRGSAPTAARTEACESRSRIWNAKSDAGFPDCAAAAATALGPLSALRTVRMILSKRSDEANCAAASRPMPRFAPVMRSVGIRGSGGQDLISRGSGGQIGFPVRAHTRQILTVRVVTGA